MSKSSTIMQNILTKFDITELNDMQIKARKAIQSSADTVLLSPTGTGKTIAFLLPVIEALNSNCDEIQALILVPSRELAIQIEQVARKIGSGFKINAVYGGRSGSLDKIDLKHRPALLIGTPGRIADRLRRDNYPLDQIKTLVLDEFDKSLEIGYEKEMKEIIEQLPNVQKRILTSATSDTGIPPFVGLNKPVFINYLHKKNSKLAVKVITSPDKDKLATLLKTLKYIGTQPGIVFCSFKDSLQRISDYLSENNIEHGCFHGDMEQMDREETLIKFRNGTCQLLVATDLAARGLDIPEIKFILHYHLPLRDKEFTHRNGRTARMKRDGIAYILQWKEEELPDFIQEISPEIIDVSILNENKTSLPQQWKTLYITGGRRDKISKGDIAGWLIKQGNVPVNEIGNIEISQSCAYVAVQASIVKKIISTLNNCKLKTKKVRISEV